MKSSWCRFIGATPEQRAALAGLCACNHCRDWVELQEHQRSYKRLVWVLSAAVVAVVAATAWALIAGMP